MQYADIIFMGFCTNCGNNIGDNHRFCMTCGTPVDPPPHPESKVTTKTTDTQILASKISEPLKIKSNAEIIRSYDIIDKKTLFDNGMLVLSSKDLILYTSDEKDELKRIPLSTIHSCRYSTIRGGLLIKRRINEENNFQTLLTS